ncbi:serine/threonine kinase [Nostoc sp. NIES-4103]|nr:serine/threonine kinase [Nostoc sp. NIES-4103]
MSSNLFGNASITLNNRYLILNQLGQNRVRHTLLAKDCITKQPVVIKILLFSEEFRWEDLKLFEREAETLQNLSHPAIPKYIDYFEVDISKIKGFALVQTYIEAKSLQEQVRDGRNFTEQEIKQLGKSLLAVLDYLHSRQPAVIHRDIKPSNILLTNRTGNSVGDVYLVDFGSVQTTIKTSSTRTVVGTYGYMPPEQFGGRSFPASDLYSLGATLIYLITEKYPTELLDDDLNFQIEYINNISSELKIWLELITQPSLNRRLSSSKAALELLENIDNIKDKYYQTSRTNQPKNSKIKFRKTNQNLEIFFPNKGSVTIIRDIFSWFIVCLILCTSFWGLLDNYLQPLIILILAIPQYILVCLGISLAFYIFVLLLFQIFGRVHISVGKKSIFIAKEIFINQAFIFSNPTIIATDNIWRLVSTSQYYKLVNLQKIAEEIEKTPNLIIWEGTVHQYNLNSYLDQPLTLAERNWIAQEISDFLGIPLVEE